MIERSVYLMRDNHTFRRLPDTWSENVVNIISQEYNDGETTPLVGVLSATDCHSVVMRLDELLGDFLDRVRKYVYEVHE